MTGTSAEQIIIDDLGVHWHADCDDHDFERARALPEAAMDAAGRLAERAEDEDVPLDALVRALAAMRDDRRHPMVRELGSASLYGWGDENLFNFLQELVDAILDFLEEPPSADVTILRYGHGAPDDPISPGRSLLVLDSRGRVRLTHFLWPERSVREGKLLPGVWDEILGALERSGFPERPPAGVLTAEMRKLSFTRIVGDRIEGVTAEPREPYLEIWRLLLGIIGQMRGSRDFERRVSDVKLR